MTCFEGIVFDEGKKKVSDEQGKRRKEVFILYGQVDLVLVLVPNSKEVCQMLDHSSDNRTAARLTHFWTLI